MNNKQAKWAELEEKLEGISLELTDPAPWNKIQERIDHLRSQGDTWWEYEAATLRYAAAVGRLVQYYLDHGDSFGEAANKAADEADVDIISGAMYGAAIMLLTASWRYGEELRIWHNAKYGGGSGVINPAVIHIV